jgi:hypothetical protein
MGKRGPAKGEGGRPKAEDPRVVPINVRLTKEEDRQLAILVAKENVRRLEAKGEKVSTSTFVRELILAAVGSPAPAAAPAAATPEMTVFGDPVEPGPPPEPGSSGLQIGGQPAAVWRAAQTPEMRRRWLREALESGREERGVRVRWRRLYGEGVDPVLLAAVQAEIRAAHEAAAEVSHGS